MEDMVHTKALLRTEALRRRNAISPDDRERRSRALCNKLANTWLTILPQGSVVAVYSAMGSEVDMDAFIDTAVEHDWMTCFPCMMCSQGAPASENKAPDLSLDREKSPTHMTFWALSAKDPRSEVEFLAHPVKTFDAGDPALATCTRIDARALDAVVVPLVAFDTCGNRLGYGGGNYDRLLAEVRPDTLLAGVAFAEQRVDAVPVEPHDQPLPHIFVA